MTTINKTLLSLFAAFLALSIAPLTACSPQEEQPSSEGEQQTSSLMSSSEDSSSADSEQINVTISIDPSAAKDAGADVSALEIIEGPADYSIQNGSTAYDALLATGAEVDGETSYVTSINGLAEGEAGQSSGWMYEVNGESPMVAANEYELADGDTVRWFYSSWE